MDVNMDSSDVNPPRQSSSAKNLLGKRKRSRAKRSSKRNKGRRRRPRPSRLGSSSSSRTASPRHSFVQGAQEEVNHMVYGYPSQCNRFWESYGRAFEWQHQHLISYWKSRAFALESENYQLRTFVGGMTRVNTHQCETGWPGPTQGKFCDYSVPNCSKYSKGQTSEQPNNRCRYRPSHISAATDQPSTSQHESIWSSQYKNPEKNVGIRSYLWGESIKIEDKVDNNFIPTLAENSEDVDQSFEFEINEEMIAFLEQSMKHKLELSERRKREKFATEKEKRQYEYEASLPPQHIGKQRIAEMKLLYGEGAPKIIAMETSIKLTFERRLQRDNSKVWPVIPLKP